MNSEDLRALQQRVDAKVRALGLDPDAVTEEQIEALKKVDPGITLEEAMERIRRREEKQKLTEGLNKKGAGRPKKAAGEKASEMISFKIRPSEWAQLEALKGEGDRSAHGVAKRLLLEVLAQVEGEEES